MPGAPDPVQPMLHVLTLKRVCYVQAPLSVIVLTAPYKSELYNQSLQVRHCALDDKDSDQLLSRH